MMRRIAAETLPGIATRERCRLRSSLPLGSPVRPADCPFRSATELPRDLFEKASITCGLNLLDETMPELGREHDARDAPFGVDDEPAPGGPPPRGAARWSWRRS